MTKPGKQKFSAEFKLEVVERFRAGETKLDLAREYGLSSPKIIETWARLHRRDPAQGLQPKRVGRPPKPDQMQADELTRLRRENERLRAEVAYLGKLRALRAVERG